MPYSLLESSSSCPMSTVVWRKIKNIACLNLFTYSKREAGPDPHWTSLALLTRKTTLSTSIADIHMNAIRIQHHNHDQVPNYTRCPPTLQSKK